MISQHLIPVLARAAVAAGHDPAVILAIAEIESGGRVFAAVKGRSEPLIRFEGHYFDRRLSGAKREMARLAGLADPRAGRVANPTSQSARWAMLERARAIDPKAAVESCSWGLGQVMGAHWAWLGYASVDALVAEARAGADGQLRLMLRFIAKAGLTSAIQKRDWAAFARGYNGPTYARNHYHTRLAKAYASYARLDFSSLLSGSDITNSHDASGQSGESPVLTHGARGPAVASFQRSLCALGYPVAPDGAFGQATQRAVIRFQRDNGLAPDGIVGPATFQAVSEKMPLARANRTFKSLLIWISGALSRLRLVLFPRNRA